VVSIVGACPTGVNSASLNGTNDNDDSGTDFDNLDGRHRHDPYESREGRHSGAQPLSRIQHYNIFQ